MRRDSGGLMKVFSLGSKGSEGDKMEKGYSLAADNATNGGRNGVV